MENVPIVNQSTVKKEIIEIDNEQHMLYFQNIIVVMYLFSGKLYNCIIGIFDLIFIVYLNISFIKMFNQSIYQITY
jgi:hypothetical protein